MFYACGRFALVSTGPSLEDEFDIIGIAGEVLNNNNNKMCIFVLKLLVWFLFGL